MGVPIIPNFHGQLVGKSRGKHCFRIKYLNMVFLYSFKFYRKPIQCYLQSRRGVPKKTSPLFFTDRISSLSRDPEKSTRLPGNMLRGQGYRGAFNMFTSGMGAYGGWSLNALLPKTAGG